MRNIATIPAHDREALFHNTAAKMGMTDAIIEKDFWVCYMLDYLFHRCAWKDHMNPPSLFPCAHRIVLKLYHIFKTNQQRKTAGLKPLVEWKTYFRLWVSKDATKLVFLNTENLPMWRRNQIVSKKTAESGAKTLIFG